MAEGERATGTRNTIYDLFRPFFLCYDAADRRFFRRPFVSSFPFPEGPLQCRAKGRMYSPLSFRPSVPLQWRYISEEERWARGVQTSLGHRDGCFCGGRARRDHGPRSLRARGWAICRHSPRCRDRGGPRGNFGPTIGPVVGPPFRLPAPGVDRHYHLLTGAGVLSLGASVLFLLCETLLLPSGPEVE
jgi:hypothetical protein